MSGGNYVPLYIGIGIIIIVGLLSIFISPFVPSGNTLKSGDNGYFIYTFIGTQQSLPSFDIPILSTLPVVSGFFGISFDLASPFKNIALPNPLDVLPNSWRTTFANYCVNFAYIPDYILIPMLVICVISILYSIIKLFWGN